MSWNEKHSTDGEIVIAVTQRALGVLLFVTSLFCLLVFGMCYAGLDNVIGELGYTGGFAGVLYGLIVYLTSYIVKVRITGWAVYLTIGGISIKIDQYS